MFVREEKKMWEMFTWKKRQNQLQVSRKLIYTRFYYKKVPTMSFIQRKE